MRINYGGKTVTVEKGDIIHCKGKAYRAVAHKTGQTCRDCALYEKHYRACCALDCSFFIPAERVIFEKIQDTESKQED